MPVVNPLFHKQLCTLIKLTCLSCFKLQIPDPMKLLLIAKIRLIDEGFLSELSGLEQEVGFLLASTIDESSITELVRESIDIYIDNLRNRQRFNDDVSNGSEEKISNTKNVNVQRFVYIENALKQYQAGNLCIHCQNAIPRITSFRNKIMTTKSQDNESLKR